MSGLITLQETVLRLQNGGVVGLPTETVYGLAGRADSEVALRLIFSLKQRPFFDPLIVHVDGKKSAQRYARVWPAVADSLASEFWPGPLTLVLPKAAHVSPLITSGLDTVAIRCPRHPLALEVLQAVGVGLAAPSANLFGRLSPTRAQAVLDGLPTVDVLDGGPCEIGLESTVLAIAPGPDLSCALQILRAGAIRRSDIEKHLSKSQIPFHFVAHESSQQSPGHMKHHYMPSVPLVIGLEKFSNDLVPKIFDILTKLPEIIEDVLIRKPQKIENAAILHLSKDPQIAARELYQKLREISADGPDIIYFQKPNYMHGENWEAIWNRLSKAATLILPGT